MSEKLYKLFPAEKDYYNGEKIMSKEFTLDGRNVYGTVFIDKSQSFDSEAIEKAYFEVLRRNDAFRMRLVKTRKGIRQYFQDVSLFPKPCHEKYDGDVDSFKKYCRTIKRPAISVYDPQVTMATIYTCNDGGAIIIWQHHICSDGYSADNITYNQINEFYDCYRNGEEPTKPDKEYSITYIIDRCEKNKKRNYKDLKWCFKQYMKEWYKFSIPVKPQKEDVKNIIIAEEFVGENYHKFNDLCKTLRCADTTVIMAAAAIIVYKETKKERFNFYTITHGRKNYIEKKISGAIAPQFPVFYSINMDTTIKDLIIDSYKNMLGFSTHYHFTEMTTYATLEYPLRLLRVGYTKWFEWFFFNNMRDYSCDNNKTLEIMFLDQEIMSSQINFDILEPTNGTEGIRFELSYSPLMIDNDKMEILRKEFLMTLEYMVNNLQGSIKECIEYVKGE